MYKFGEGHEKKIIFLHGGGTNVNPYLPLIYDLSHDFNVYAFDLPGHGSAKTTNDIDVAVDLVALQIRSLHLKTFSIVGHSFGGYFAFRMLEKFENIEDLILIDPMLGQYKKSISELLLWFIVKKQFTKFYKSPNLIRFHFSGIGEMLRSVYKQNMSPSKTVELLLKCIYCKKIVNEKLLEGKNIKILLGNKDEFINKKNLPKALQPYAIAFEGNHDWLMADPEKTTEIIKSYLNGED